MSDQKPVVIGLYGIPGAGKSTLLSQLKEKLSQDRFSFYEGSEVIASIVTGGLPAFQSASHDQKISWRQAAIKTIRDETLVAGHPAIVTGHFMFWPESDSQGQTVWTEYDAKTYTHIIYLDTLPWLVQQWTTQDHSHQRRSRPPASVKHLRKWQSTEKAALRRLCRDKGILFLPLPHPAKMGTITGIKRVVAMLQDFARHTDERYNLSKVEEELDAVLESSGGREKLQTAVVLDADKTLAAEDSGVLFWEEVAKSLPQPHGMPLPAAVAAVGGVDDEEEDDRSLKTLFSTVGYTYPAFRQATLLYEEAMAAYEGDDDNRFNTLCERVAARVSLYPEIQTFLEHITKHPHVIPVVATCGLRRVWELVLARAGLSPVQVPVIGGGRVSNGFVVTPAVKQAVVARLRDTHNLYVLAIGDSPLDLPMLREAHESLVVVGPPQTRSKSMDGLLRDAIDAHGLRASQVLLAGPSASRPPPRLDPSVLPAVDLLDPSFLASLVRARTPSARLVHATDLSSTRLLATATRDAAVSGPALRAAHHRIGWHLATSYLSQPHLLGLEEYPIAHVQGHAVLGHRIRHEARTTIVAAMRAGEPMALGVSEALPGAMFVHARRPDDVREEHVRGRRAVVVVDAVVNGGGTVAGFVRRIRGMGHETCKGVAIVVVAGVVQKGAVEEGGTLRTVLEQDRAVSVVALRLSENKFTGKGGTDTGNRLFNSTQLP